MEKHALKNEDKRKLITILLLLSAFIIGLGCYRIYTCGNIKGIFLVWNLFLAWIPFSIAYILSRKISEISFPVLITGLALWLLFLPNAPYIITDLIHLRPRDGIPLWYDAVLFFLFAFHGLLLGLLSTLFIHEVLIRYLSPVKVWIILTGCFVMSGYGIYLGRFLRWNSWDIVVNPIELLTESFVKMTNPTAIRITAMFALIFFFSYLIFYQLIHLKKDIHGTENV